MGIANVVWGLFGGTPCTGVLVRTGVNVASGATNKISQFINAISVLLIIMVSYLARAFTNTRIADLPLLCSQILNYYTLQKSTLLRFSLRPLLGVREKRLYYLRNSSKISKPAKHGFKLKSPVEFFS